MRAKFFVLAPIVCVVVGSSANPAAAQTLPYYPNPYSQPAAPYDPSPAGTPTAPGPQPAPQEPVDWGPARSHPHDYPGPPLRGGNGGG
jgi:hypothetical protein